LDAYIAATTNIQLIKIDVEGGEMLVLKGAIQTLQRCKPIVLFEFGMAGANAYGVNPLAMFQFFSETLNYEIFTLQNWLKGNAALSFSQFNSLYEANTEYFFSCTNYCQSVIEFTCFFLQEDKIIYTHQCEYSTEISCFFNSQNH
jgi:hypothetical protein